MQQTTPVVSANVDGPSVVPKQIPKKIPKTVNTTTTSPPPPQLSSSTITATTPPTHETEEKVEEKTLEIEKVTEELEQMSVEDTNPAEICVNNNISAVPVTEVVEIDVVEEEMSSQETENNQQQQPEEVIAENSPNNNTELTEEDDDDKKVVDKQIPVKNLLGAIDETDRGLPVDLSHRPEHVKKEFMEVMEKYDGKLKDCPKDSAAAPGNGDNNKGILALDAKQQQQQQNEKLDPESEDDDADKENNIQNKKSQQEVSNARVFVRYLYVHEWLYDDDVQRSNARFIADVRHTSVNDL